MRTLYLSLALLLAGTPAHAAPDAPPAYTVAFAQDTLDNDWRVAQVEEVAAALADDPAIRFVYSDGKGQTARQIQNIEDFILSRVDVLITSPRDAQAMTPVIGKARRQGIPVILLTRHIDSDEYTALLRLDDRAIARRAAAYLLERLQGRGTILMLQGVPTATTAIDRSEGFLEETNRHPGIQVISRTANYLRNDALRATAELLQAGVRFDAIYAQSDSMASGARLALRKHGVDPKDVLIVGIDYIQEAREAIRRGEQSASFTYPTCGREGAEYARRLLIGQDVPKDTVLESVMVTQDNVETVEPIF